MTLHDSHTLSNWNYIVDGGTFMFSDYFKLVKSK